MPRRAFTRQVKASCGSGKKFPALQTCGYAPPADTPSFDVSFAAFTREKHVCCSETFACSVRRVGWPARPAGL